MVEVLGPAQNVASVLFVGSLRSTASAGKVASSAQIDRNLRATGSNPFKNQLLDRRSGQEVADRALSAGQSIVSALKFIEEAAIDARDIPLISKPPHNRAPHLTAAHTLTDQITKLVNASEFKGFNLLRTGGPDLTVQTTRFGGRIAFAAQPLDLQALGLEDLPFTALDSDIETVIARVGNALGIAQGTLRNLEEIERYLDNRTQPSFGVQAASGGMLVDLFG